MSFQYVPGQVRTPEIPNFSPSEGMWRGKGSDDGLYVLRGAGYSWGNFVMVRSPDFCPSLLIDNSTYKPVFSDVNGYIYWQGSGYVYYTQTYGWVLCSKFPGYEPLEEYERDEKTGEGKYKGDDFWTFSSFPSGEDRDVTMTPRGAQREKESKKLKMTWERWVGNQEFGEYEGKGGASGKKVLGLPQFRGNGETFLRSLNKENGYYTYGRIHHTGSKWVIGEVGSASGWHEGSEPKPDGGSVTFAFCRPEGSDITGQNITVSFDRYVCGDERDTAYLGEVAVWR